MCSQKAKTFFPIRVYPFPEGVRYEERKQKVAKVVSLVKMAENLTGVYSLLIFLTTSTVFQLFRNNAYSKC